jgi:flagellar P-ring protein FlgI
MRLSFVQPRARGRALGLLAMASLLLYAPVSARAQVRLSEICRVKGQEENVLHGFGLVVGLNGTGDGDRPATRALAQAMQRMGTSIGRDRSGGFDLSELRNAKNVALVFVTASIPPTGGRQGGRVNCQVSAVSAKSLAGGMLITTPLLGPLPADRRTYAFASGPITIEDGQNPTVGKVHQGCQLVWDFPYKFHQDGKLTLVINDHHASFQMALMIQNEINSSPMIRVRREQLNHPSQPGYGGLGEADSATPPRTGEPGRNAASGSWQVARALDARNVEVMIPKDELENPVNFLADVLSIPLEMSQMAGSRVVIFEKSQVIVVGEDVTILPVAIAHKNLSIEAGGQNVNRFVELRPQSEENEGTYRLSALVSALNALKVEPADKIEIIKAIHRQGALLGELAIE